MRKLIAIALLAVCAAAHAGNLPANYKTLALAAVKGQLRDPGSVQALRLTADPPYDDRGMTVVTALVNAKNGFGGYTGNIPAWVKFRDGRVVDVLIYSGF